MATWLDKIDNIDLEIITGDGNGYIGQYFISTVSQEVSYNISEFVFKDIDGSLVVRGRPRGTVYEIEFLFIGLDCLDTLKKFKDSAKDPRAWNIRHPMYGVAKVQPVRVHYDNSQLNITKVNAQIIETLGVSDLKDITDFPPATIKAKQASISANYAVTFSSGVPNPDTSTIQRALNNIKNCYASVSAKLNGYQQDVDDYVAAYNKANAALNTVIYDSQTIAEQAQNLIIAPALFTDTVIRRMQMFQAQAAILVQDVASILAVYNRSTKNLKKLFENNAGAVVLGMCVASITNILHDYDYRIDVLNTIDTIVSTYNTYLTNLYTLQSPNGGQLDSYIPDPTALTGLAQLVNYTTSNLLTISNNAKQERSMILDRDMTVIEVAYELYGLQQDDSTIQTVINNNKIGLNEKLMIKKGRKILYYV